MLCPGLSVVAAYVMIQTGRRHSSTHTRLTLTVELGLRITHTTGKGSTETLSEIGQVIILIYSHTHYTST